MWPLQGPEFSSSHLLLLRHDGGPPGSDSAATLLAAGRHSDGREHLGCAAAAVATESAVSSAAGVDAEGASAAVVALQGVKAAVGNAGSQVVAQQSATADERVMPFYVYGQSRERLRSAAVC